MSRSYRRFALAKDREKRVKRRFRQKTFANRAVRRCKEIPGKQGWYRKLFDSWDISDWRYVASQDEKEELRREQAYSKLFGTDFVSDDVVNEWYKYYKRK